MHDFMKIPPPPAIRPEWIQGAPERLIMDSSGTVLVTYDGATRSGGVHRIEEGLWLILGPVSLQEFAAALPNLGVQLPDVHDLQRWLDAVSSTDTQSKETRQ